MNSAPTETPTLNPNASHSDDTHPGLGSLADDARALIAATAEVAGEQVEHARSRLTAALNRGRHLSDRVREETREGAEAAGAVVKAHPYQAIALGAGIGALFGYLVARRCNCRRE